MNAPAPFFLSADGASVWCVEHDAPVVTRGKGPAFADAASAAAFVADSAAWYERDARMTRCVFLHPDEGSAELVAARREREAARWTAARAGDRLVAVPNQRYVCAGCARDLGLRFDRLRRGGPNVTYDLAGRPLCDACFANDSAGRAPRATARPLQP